jgi:hypothetical protein
VAWANYHFLGCRYPPQVEADIGRAAKFRSAVVV